MSLFELFFCNRAETHPQHPDPELRTRAWHAGIAVAMAAVRARIGALPRWRIVYDSPGSGRIFAERTGRLPGLVSEVCVTFRSPQENRVEIDAKSVSRIGVGDLGQSARDLRELFAGLSPPETPPPGAFSAELPG